MVRLMRLHGVRPKRRWRYKMATDSRHSLSVAENHLNRQFEPEVPNQAWAADITYIWTREGWLTCRNSCTMAVVMDLFSRRIVGWAMQPRLKQSLHKRGLVTGALKMALQCRGVSSGMLFHSGWGSQYASSGYQALLSEASIICSMSRKGDYWDNAPAESLFAT